MTRRAPLIVLAALLLAAPAARAEGPKIRFEPVGPSPAASKPPTSIQNYPIFTAPGKHGVGTYIPPGGLRPGAAERPRPTARRAAPSRPGWPNRSGPLDERPLWNLLHARRYAELRRAIALAHAIRPYWHPPARMLELMQETELAGKLRAALARHDHAAILALEADAPTQFTPAHLDARWAWIGALSASGRPDDALSAILATLDAAISDRDRLATLQKAAGWLGPAGQESLIHLELGRPHGTLFGRQLQNLLVDAHLARLGVALRMHDDKEAQRIAAEVAPDVVRRRDAHLAVALGWLARRTNDPDTAKLWFDRAATWAPQDTEVISALAQAGETATAERLIGIMHLDDPRRTELERLLQIMEAHADLADQRPEEALGKLEQIAQGGPLPPDAQLLRIRAEVELGRFDEATRIMRTLPFGTPQRTEANRAIALARANAAYNDQHYTEVLHQLATPGVEALRDARLLRAWTLYNMGDATRAAPLFAELFDEHADERSAEGLYFSATKANRLELLASRRTNPVFAKVLADERARNALALGHYGEAYAQSPPLYPQLGGYELPSLKLGLSRRDRTGEVGLSRLQVTRAPVSDVRFGFTSADEFHLMVDRLIMDTGPASATALVGSVPSTGAQVPLGYGQDQVIGLEPKLRYEHQGKSGLRAQVGITPTGGPLPSAWTGELFWDAADDLGTTSVGGFARPVMDSRLSMVGLVDPYTGKAWGRVTSIGASVSRDLTLTSVDRLSGNLQLDALQGDGVADNDHTAIQVGWRRSLSHPAFQYVAYGIDGFLETYRRNLSGFTLGDGGYFSPQLHTRIRFGIDARTSDLKPLVLVASVGVGPGYAWVDDAPYFPLNPDGRNNPGYERTTVYYDADLKAVTHLTDWSQAGLGLTIYRNADYEEHVISLFARFLLGPRGAAVSGDLQ